MRGNKRLDEERREEVMREEKRLDEEKREEVMREEKGSGMRGKRGYERRQ